MRMLCDVDTNYVLSDYPYEAVDIERQVRTPRSAADRSRSTGLTSSFQTCCG